MRSNGWFGFWNFWVLQLRVYHSKLGTELIFVNWVLSLTIVKYGFVSSSTFFPALDYYLFCFYFKVMRHFFNISSPFLCIPKKDGSFKYWHVGSAGLKLVACEKKTIPLATVYFVLKNHTLKDEIMKYAFLPNSHHW